MSDGVLEPGEVARQVFGASIDAAVAYAHRLATDGVDHGHIGPREVPTLWARHLVNSALVTDLVPPNGAVLDVGSGAGLPGLAMALRRPDLRLILLEPKQRRVAFLQQVVRELELAERVTVVRGRAEDTETVRLLAGQSFVTARAVAPLARLVEWSLPLLAPEGWLLALKGASARDEAERDHDVVVRSGGSAPTIVELSAGGGERTWVVSVQRRPSSGRIRPRRTR